MKLMWFHLMPYTRLPDDFRQRHNSVWVDIDRSLFGSLEHFPDIRRGLSEIARILRPGARAVLIVPNFYVKTEQPMEFRTHYWAWKRLFESAGLRVDKVATDWGPPVFKNANLKRAIARMIGKVLSAVPFMQYQFIFVVRRCNTSDQRIL